MAVGQTSGAPSSTYTCKISSCDPTQRLVEIIFKGDLRRIQVSATPIAFRWPVVGETWVVKNINNTWYLDSPYPQEGGSASVVIEDIPAGDAVINSPTGIVHILGSSDGSTDWSFSKIAGGALGGTYPNPSLQASQAQLASSTGLTTVNASLITVTPGVAGTYLVMMTADFAATVTGWSDAVVSLFQNGALVTGSTQGVLGDNGNTSQRVPVANMNIVILTDTDTISLAVRKTSSGGTVTASAQHTQLTYLKVA